MNSSNPPIPTPLPHHVPPRHLPAIKGLPPLTAIPIRPPALLPPDHPARRVLPAAPTAEQVLPLPSLLLLLLLLLLRLPLRRLGLRLVVRVPLRRLVILLLRGGQRCTRATVL